MKILNLLLWVTQFGFSLLFHMCFFLWLAWWLQTRFALGMWIFVVFGVIGLMTSISTAKACIQSLLKAAEEAAAQAEAETKAEGEKLSLLVEPEEDGEA